MGLAFLAPLFLAALAGVAIPVLIHLTNRPRDNVVRFPSLIFLRRIPFRSVRRRKIRHWWLLALRVAAVVILAAAFARPFFASSGQTAAAGVARETIILLDRSFSMSYGDRWGRALDAAREAVRGLAAEDRGTIVAFAEAGVVLAGPTNDHGALLAALETVQPGHGTTRLGSAVAMAEELLADALGEPEVIVISDLQRSALGDAEETRLPPGTRVTIVSLAGNVPTNLAVQDVAVERLAEADRERLAVSARIVNTGTEAAAAVPVRLDLNGTQLLSQVTDIPARGASSIRFDGIPAPTAAARLTVRAGDDPLSGDNVRYAAIQPGSALGVLVLADDPARALFVRRALEIGTDPRFRPRVVRVSGVTARDFEDARVAIFLDPPGAAAARQAARALVDRGGGVLLTAGSRGTTAAGGDQLDPLAGPRGSVIERLGDNGGRLGAPDYDHGVFHVFRTPRSGDLSAARFFRYRQVGPAAGLNVVARFDDGTPAMIEVAGAGGRVLWWTSSLDEAWSDFPLQPVFLPFLHRVVRYLAGYEPPKLSATVGEPLDLSRLALAQNRAQIVVESPSGKRTPVRTGEGEPGFELAEPGYYTVRAVGSVVPEAVAVNLRPEESDLDALDAAEVRRRLMPGGESADGAVVAALPAAERERRQGLWWYLLIGVVSALIAESVLANRLPVSTEVYR